MNKGKGARKRNIFFIIIIALCVLFFFIINRSPVNECPSCEKYVIYGTPLFLNIYVLVINEHVNETFKPTLYVYENGESSIGNHYDLRDYLDLYNRPLTPMERVMRDKGAKVSNILFEKIYSYISDHFKVASENLYSLYKLEIHIDNQLKISSINKKKQDPTKLTLPNIKTDLVCLLENRCVDSNNWIKLD